MTKNRRTRGFNRGFTLTELLIVIGILALLAAILFPVFAQVRGKARETVCVSNLRQIGAATLMYAEDADNRFPLGGDPIDIAFPDSWGSSPFRAQVKALHPLPEVMDSYLKERRVWRCPSDSGFTDGGRSESIPFDTRPSSFEKYGSSYYYFTTLALYGDPVSSLTAHTNSDPRTERGPSQIVFLYDGTGIWHGGYVLETRRYSSLYADGHVKTLPRRDFQSAFDLSFDRPN